MKIGFIYILAIEHWIFKILGIGFVIMKIRCPGAQI